MNYDCVPIRMKSDYRIQDKAAEGRWGNTQAGPVRESGGLPSWPDQRYLRDTLLSLSTLKHKESCT